jgi:hypothetical protein
MENGWQDGNAEFFGTETMAETLTRARDGWAEGAEKCKKLAEALFEEISRKVEKPVPVQDVEGEEFDVGALLAGEPEHWTRWENERSGSTSMGRLLTVVYNGSELGHVMADAMAAKGAVTVALIEALELAGFRVELVLSYGTYSDRKILEQYIQVKKPSQPPDLSRLAVALADPSAFRRLCFSSRMTQGTDEDKRTWDPNESRSHDVEFGGDIYIGTRSGGIEDCHWSDEKDARAWVLARLQEQGVKLIDEKGE